MNNKFGSPKVNKILKLEKDQVTFLKKLKEKQGIINWSVLTIFFISLFIVIVVSVGPFFSVKYKIVSSSFDSEMERKIIEDYNRLPNDTGKYIPFKDFDQNMAKSSFLEEYVEKELVPLVGDYGIFIKNIFSGEEIGVNKEKVFTAASLSKLFVAGSYYDYLEGDPVIGDSVLRLQDRDRVGGFGYLFNEPIGSEYYPDTLVEEMLSQSDNTAFSMMVRFLGINRISDFIKDNGFTNTSFENNTSTPHDMGLFLEKLYKKELFGEYYRDRMMDFMKDTAHEDRIPYYLPLDVSVAHKIGNWTGAYSDAGIVFGKSGDYIIVIMTDNADYEESINAMRQVSRVVYEYFNQNF